MKSSILNTTVLNQVVKNLKEAGYDLIKTDQAGAKPLYEVKLDGETIFWAMPHSTGKNYLVRYDEELITKEQA